MRTMAEVKERLADFETRFEARLRATPGRDVRGEKALELEMLGSWIGALKWMLDKDIDSPAVAHGEAKDGRDLLVKIYPRGVIDLFWGDGLVTLIDQVVIARGDEIIDPEERKKVLLAWAQAAAFEYLRHGQEIPLEDFLSGDRGLVVKGVHTTGERVKP